ncbi:hypothetical protein SELR_24310 [Selenomonas ruminantium subsp. lactilytica TAM6421]|uniref:Uncharacterized protein n=1 Tax=Selenomonas ruminantium subsp. lactilytica (strain NBRC 103574 / TAM6421) TaxID=927704 RepID=I0GTQ2_SELRL|nr:hypothetical protein SELR_03350 [Selenomonas ruminantium subsp. lactilytica TAM6421]BAL84139.1 hypothetical protein SELR_24310 [Selenomonas ruminantium subsp. lactilytica TAM6421]
MLFRRRNDCLNEVKAGPQTAFAGCFVDGRAAGLARRRLLEDAYFCWRVI